jgi:hypothetical protein
MADLLQRMAARTLGHAATMTPRIRSWYEPAPEPSIVDVEVPTPPSTVDAGSAAARVPAATPHPGGEPRAISPPPATAGRAAEPVTVTPATPRPPVPDLDPVAVTPLVVAVPAVAAMPPAVPTPLTTTPLAPPPGAAVPRPPAPPTAPPQPRRTPGGRTPAPARPDVHITIGRIEVRAEPAPAPPTADAARPVARASRPAESPVLTLSAYLRGDDGRPR